MNPNGSRYHMYPKCYTVQSIISGEENRKNIKGIQEVWLGGEWRRMEPRSSAEGVRLGERN